jgi:hypothetical protein
MIFILNIYKKDSRTKSGRRLMGSYEYERKDLDSMKREVKELHPLYKTTDGYTFELIENYEN